MGSEYVWVPGYERKDGTTVQGHYRRVAPGAKGTHTRVRSYDRGSGKVKSYIRSKTTRGHVIRPHIRSKGGKKSFVRGSVRGKDAYISPKIAKQYGNRDVFTEKARQQTKRIMQQGDIVDPSLEAFVKTGSTDQKQRIITTGPQLIQALEEERDLHVRQGIGGAIDGASQILAIADRTIPVETGFMSSTKFIQRSDEIEDAIVMGYDAHYTIYQHENLDLAKKPGQRAKWLELTIMENPHLIEERILSGIRRLYGPSEFTAEGAIYSGEPYEGIYGPPFAEYGPENDML